MLILDIENNSKHKREIISAMAYHSQALEVNNLTPKFAQQSCDEPNDNETEIH